MPFVLPKLEPVIIKTDPVPAVKLVGEKFAIVTGSKLLVLFNTEVLF